jgi:cbb3-type cytochrome oxidase subunit 3
VSIKLIINAVSIATKTPKAQKTYEHAKMLTKILCRCLIQKDLFFQPPEEKEGSMNKRKRTPARLFLTKADSDGAKLKRLTIFFALVIIAILTISLSPLGKIRDMTEMTRMASLYPFYTFLLLFFIYLIPFLYVRHARPEERRQSKQKESNKVRG